MVIGKKIFQADGNKQYKAFEMTFADDDFSLDTIADMVNEAEDNNFELIILNLDCLDHRSANRTLQAFSAIRTIKMHSDLPVIVKTQDTEVLFSAYESGADMGFVVLNDPLLHGAMSTLAADPVGPGSDVLTDAVLKEANTVGSGSHIMNDKVSEKNFVIKDLIRCSAEFSRKFKVPLAIDGTPQDISHEEIADLCRDAGLDERFIFPADAFRSMVAHD
ncbi:MAG: hypothetical protein VZR00_00195 [Lachnospiraceae bacterium]|jgi:hypothetical protein|nr:hypothetical protein [Lachnospiraceae bacterium]MEE3460297.1 hypothetical protein [Lachnospiraceae bacterium]